MNYLDDENYYNNCGFYPHSTLSRDEHNVQSSSKASFNANKDSSGDEEIAPGREQRPTKFPVKNELDMILRKVRSVLNKISALNYSKLQKRWVNLIPTESDQLTEILQLLVAKGMDDPMYMQIYARLTSDVLGVNPSITNSLRNKLSNLLHHELQNVSTDIELAKFGCSELREDAARRKKVMLHRFIAELFVENVCSVKFVTERVTDLIGQAKKIPQEAAEPLECLCVLLMFAGSKLEECQGVWLDDVFSTLNLSETSTLPIISKRMHFMLLDLIETRLNGWKTPNKWWVPGVQFQDSTTENELDSLKAITSKSRRQSRKRASSNSKRPRSKTLRTILNQVVPSNLDRMVLEFGQVLQARRSSLDSSAENIINYIWKIRDPMYLQIQASLISNVCGGFPPLKKKLVSCLFKYIKEYPESSTLMQFCTQLYISGWIPLGTVISTLEKNQTRGIEGACTFFFRAQFKLYRDWNKIPRFEKSKVDALIECITRNAQTEAIRLKCMVLDVNDIRRSKWGFSRPLLWNSASLNVRMLTAQDALNAFNINEEDGLEIMQENLGTNRAEIDKFVKTLCIWAVDAADLALLAKCGKYIKCIIEIKLLNTTRLQPILGWVVHQVARLKGKPDAWTHLGIILQELYNP